MTLVTYSVLTEQVRYTCFSNSLIIFKINDCSQENMSHLNLKRSQTGNLSNLPHEVKLCESALTKKMWKAKVRNTEKPTCHLSSIITISIRCYGDDEVKIHVQFYKNISSKIHVSSFN